MYGWVCVCVCVCVCVWVWVRAYECVWVCMSVYGCVRISGCKTLLTGPCTLDSAVHASTSYIYFRPTIPVSHTYGIAAMQLSNGYVFAAFHCPFCVYGWVWVSVYEWLCVWVSNGYVSAAFKSSFWASEGSIGLTWLVCMSECFMWAPFCAGGGKIGLIRSTNRIQVKD